MTKGATLKAILIEQGGSRQKVGLAELPRDRLPDGDVTVRIACSTLNYKDALAITGKSPVVRSFPMVPGIDFAGTVEESSNANFKPGDRVVLNGWGVGERHWGGLAELARVKGEWLVPLEPALTFAQAMSIGTAGYTAMLCPWNLNGTASDLEAAKCSSPGQRAASGAWQRCCWRSLATQWWL